MGRKEEIVAFIKSSFPSIWALEILLHLRDQPWATLSREQILAQMRASDTIVTTCMASLIAAGMVVQEGDAFRYSPSSEELGSLIDETERLYRIQPNAVRRVIVMGGDSLAAFADAFRLRRDSDV